MKQNRRRSFNRKENEEKDEMNNLKENNIEKSRIQDNIDINWFSNKVTSDNRIVVNC